MRFQFKTLELLITVLLFIMMGVFLGSFLYGSKSIDYLIFSGMMLLPALTLVLKARVKTNNKKQVSSN